jgi:dolichol kinase
MGFEIFILCIWFAFLPAQQRLLNAAIGREFITPFAARKISHLTVGFWVVPLAAFVHRWYLVAIPITMILAANVHANSQRGNLGRLHKRLLPLVGFLLPEILILYFWHQQRNDLVVLAVLAMTVGDTAAALAGIRFGRYRVAWTGKTVEGAVANFVASALVLVSVGHGLYQMPIGVLLLPAGVGCLIEAGVRGEWDNPLLIASSLILLQYPLLT